MNKKLEIKVVGLCFLILVAGVAAICLSVINKEKRGINKVSGQRLQDTAKVITQAIELTMLEGRAEVTKDLTENLKFASGFEGIEVYNWEGREAFKKKAPVTETSAIERLKDGKETFTVQDKQSLKVYMPLLNKQTCKGCHVETSPLLGVVKVSVSLADEYASINSFIFYLVIGCTLGVMFIGGLMWLIMRKLVINPIKSLEYAAERMAVGDLTFKTGIISTDEVGRLNESIEKSLHSVSGVLRRIKDVSARIARTTDVVEQDSGKVVERTMVEGEAVSEISSFIEELNAAIAEISESTESLAKSVEITASSIEQMTSSITEITNLTHDVSEGVDSTSSSIEELSATIKEVAYNAGELSKLSDDTMAAVDEIMASVKEVDSRAKESAAVSHKVMNDAMGSGMSSVNKAIEGMENIRGAVSKTASAVEKLGARSEEIGSILNVIDEITDQTTLLALNAAILAAQAGEHGKGFSVVANEIKDLAERTAFSTKEIDNLIHVVRQELADAIIAMDEGIDSVEEGIKRSKDVSSTFRLILDNSKVSAEMASMIERTTEEQSRSARYVAEAVDRVRSMVNQIAKATSEQSRGVNLIIGAAEKIRDASHQADNATKQQAEGSRQISFEVEKISERSQQISRAIREQKMGANQIWLSIERIKDLPKDNRELSFKINRSVQGLLKDSELVLTELERFKFHRATELDVIGFGVVPFEAPAEIFRRFSPIVEYLSREIGKRFELRVPLDFESVGRDILSGETQVCFMTSIVYAKARQSANVKLLVKSVIDGRATHRSAIVVPEGSDIRTLRSLAGCSMAFVDENSASGFYVPAAMLMDEAVGLRDLAKHDFLGTHDEVMKALVKGDYDCGAVMESVALKYKDRGVRIIAVSKDMPTFNISVAPSLSDDIKAKLKAALLKLRDDSPEGLKVLRAIDKAMNGFEVATDDDYNLIREMIERVSRA